MKSICTFLMAVFLFYPSLGLSKETTQRQLLDEANQQAAKQIQAAFQDCGLTLNNEEDIVAALRGPTQAKEFLNCVVYSAEDTRAKAYRAYQQWFYSASAGKEHQLANVVNQNSGLQDYTDSQGAFANYLKDNGNITNNLRLHLQLSVLYQNWAGFLKDKTGRQYCLKLADGSFDAECRNECRAEGFEPGNGFRCLTADQWQKETRNLEGDLIGGTVEQNEGVFAQCKASFPNENDLRRNSSLQVLLSDRKNYTPEEQAQVQLIKAVFQGANPSSYVSWLRFQAMQNNVRILREYIGFKAEDFLSEIPKSCNASRIAKAIWTAPVTEQPLIAHMRTRTSDIDDGSYARRLHDDAIIILDNIQKLQKGQQGNSQPLMLIKNKLIENPLLIGNWAASGLDDYENFIDSPPPLIKVFVDATTGYSQSVALDKAITELGEKFKFEQAELCKPDGKYRVYEFANNLQITTPILDVFPQFKKLNDCLSNVSLSRSGNHQNQNLERLGNMCQFPLICGPFNVVAGIDDYLQSRYLARQCSGVGTLCNEEDKKIAQTLLDGSKWKIGLGMLGFASETTILWKMIKGAAPREMARGLIYSARQALITRRVARLWTEFGVLLSRWDAANELRWFVSSNPLYWRIRFFYTITVKTIKNDQNVFIQIAEAFVQQLITRNQTLTRSGAPGYYMLPQIQELLVYAKRALRSGRLDEVESYTKLIIEECMKELEFAHDTIPTVFFEFAEALSASTKTQLTRLVEMLKAMTSATNPIMDNPELLARVKKILWMFDYSKLPPADAQFIRSLVPGHH